jgi:predicted Zn-ribbon and HTH transcriptional regulator
VLVTTCVYGAQFSVSICKAVFSSKPKKQRRSEQSKNNKMAGIPYAPGETLESIRVFVLYKYYGTTIDRVVNVLKYTKEKGVLHLDDPAVLTRSLQGCRRLFQRTLRAFRNGFKFEDAFGMTVESMMDDFQAFGAPSDIDTPDIYDIWLNFLRAGPTGELPASFHEALRRADAEKSEKRSNSSKTPDYETSAKRKLAEIMKEDLTLEALSKMRKILEESENEIKDAETPVDCPICLETIDDVGVVLSCGHALCEGCYKEFRGMRGPKKCALCRQTPSETPHFTLGVITAGKLRKMRTLLN